MRELVFGRALLLAIPLAIAAAACGGGGTNQAAPSSTLDAQSAANLTPDQQAALSAYNDCLRQNGVDPATITDLPGAAFGARNSDGTRGTGSRPTDGTRPTNGSRPGDFPGGANGSLGPRGTIDPAVQQARTACQNLLPQGVTPNGNLQLNQDAFRAYLSCLSDNGVVVPSTTAPTTTIAGAAPATGPNGSRGPGGFGGGGGGLAGLDRNQPAFAAADAKCQVLLPDGFGRPATTSSSTTTTR
jgi:hypothetical protein